MARKDGGESEGIVLYPSRLPSLGWKPTPLAPLVRGVKAMRPTRGFSTTPMRKGLCPSRRKPHHGECGEMRVACLVKYPLNRA